ncbi:Amidase [Parasponia andersonii]|uniref:Amidase n=1 Tax=Parasponia andersonii TaxID=3476 RepID=A0A2P5C1Y1_PARAD|nr:Amidase [Parasponia andersonii]
MLEAKKTNGIREEEKAALADLATKTRNGFVKFMRKYKLDALVAGVGPGYIEAQPDLIPFGIFFGGLKGSEPKLIEIAYGFEQATKVRKPPSL